MNENGYYTPVSIILWCLAIIFIIYVLSLIF